MKFMVHDRARTVKKIPQKEHTFYSVCETFGPQRQLRSNSCFTGKSDEIFNKKAKIEKLK